MDPAIPKAPVPQITRRGRSVRTYGLLFLASLAIRMVCWLPVVQSGTPPMYDEVSYVSRAVGYEDVLKAYLKGGIFWAQPTKSDLERAYQDGGWPPLHPLLIGAAFGLFGRGMALARLVVVLQGALTTCVVFALTARLSTRRVALVAAGLHIFYPSFLAYAHLLWSETTYVLACLSALYFAVRAVDADRPGRQVLLAGLSGACLGLAGLTRAAVLPLLIVVPAWLAWKTAKPRQRLVLPVVGFGMSVLVLSPWLATLHAREQRLVLLSTTAGYNLYLGNNPWIGEEHNRPKIRAALNAHMRERGVSRDEAGRALALAYIREDPGGFVWRSWRHARALWVPDWYVMRHVLYATYPALPTAAAVALLGLLAASVVLLLGCAGYGFGCCGPEFRHRSLLLGCVLFGMLPSLPTIANSRMTLPLLAMLLPAAGVGLTTLAARRVWIRAAAVLAATGVALWALNPSLPRGALGTRNQASAHYASMVHWLERLFGAEGIATQDRLLLRCTDGNLPGAVHLSILSDGYVFGATQSRSLSWPYPAPGEVKTLKIRAPHAAAEPPTLRLTLPATTRSATIQPVQPEAWRRWHPTGLNGIEYAWMGSVGLSDAEVARLFR